MAHSVLLTKATHRTACFKKHKKVISPLQAKNPRGRSLDPFSNLLLDASATAVSQSWFLCCWKGGRAAWLGLSINPSSTGMQQGLPLQSPGPRIAPSDLVPTFVVLSFHLFTKTIMENKTSVVGELQGRCSLEKCHLWDLPLRLELSEHLGCLIVVPVVVLEALLGPFNVHARLHGEGL